MGSNEEAMEYLLKALKKIREAYTGPKEKNNRKNCYRSWKK